MLRQYNKGNLKYKELKDVTSDALVDLTSGFRRKKDGLSKTKIKNDIEELSKKARVLARETLREVRELVGLRKITYDMKEACHGRVKNK